MTERKAVELQHHGEQSRNTSVVSYLSHAISSSSLQSSECVEIKNQACKVNESLYELHKSSACPSIQIVLFHGLQPGDYSDAHLRTWQSEDGSCIWPQTWLVDDVPGAHMLSVCYSGGLAKTSDNYRERDIYIITENLLSDLLQGNIGKEENCPVILVGHSIGGLVIKHLCNRANLVLNQKEGREKARLQKFLDNIEGVFYYATPHHGASIPKKWEEDLPHAFVTYFKTLSTEAARLNDEFEKLKRERNWTSLSLGEDCPTNSGPLKGSSTSILVPEASAREGDFNLVYGADHFSICKPSDKLSRRFYKLKDFAVATAKAAEEDAKEREAIRLQEEARAREAIRLQEEARVPENFQYVPKSVTGLDSQVQNIVSKLGSTKTLGLVGMGGLGKTTLAMEVFNRLAADFEYTCFIPDVKFIDGDKRKVFDEIEEYMHFHGKKVQQERAGAWKRKPFLLVLDDISGERDLNVLSELDDTTTAESHIIFTSRNQSPFGFADKVYGVDVLDNASAKQLFLSCAFPEHKTPPTKLEGLLNDIVQKCEGLPLALEVLGKSLRTVEKYEIWKETLEAIGRADVVRDVNERLWAKLKLSYDGLEGKAQQMFLDVTTFFISGDWTLREAKAAWRVAYDTRQENLLWKQLMDISLVYDVRDDEHIRVHEQLKSLGRQIARDSMKNSREWDGDEGLKLLQNTEELQNRKIFALRISPKHTRVTTQIAQTTMRNLMELRYLEVNVSARVHGVQDCVQFQSNLILLRCKAAEVSKVLLHPSLGTNIVLLYLDWGESSLPTCIGGFSKLRFLKLYSASSLIILPNEMGNLSQLEYLELFNCSSLQTLPESFGSLLALQHLQISHCSTLQTLPESFGNLLALQHLQFSSCSKLQTLPESFGNLPALQHLEFSGCFELQTLPESFGNLPALQHLQFSSCSELRTLPESFGNLPALQHLEFFLCSKLQTLPESFGNLSALQHFKLFSCFELRTLPKSFRKLLALQHLEFFSCSKLQTLPKSFGNLPALQHLELNCFELQTLPESFGNLPALQHLIFSSCSELRTLPESFGNLPALQHLEFFRCSKLQTLPESFGNLSALQHLEFFSCPKLQNLPEFFGDLPALQHLEFSSCSELRTLPESFKNLLALQHLEFFQCSKLQSLPKSFGDLPALQHLEFFSCSKLQTLPESFGNLPALQHLELNWCSKLQTLPESFGNLPALQHLKFFSSSELCLPESFGNLPALQHLEVNCFGLRTLPKSFGNLPGLQHLELNSFELQTLPESFGNLSALQHVEFAGCSKLQTLPESFGNLPALQHLKFFSCSELQTLPESFGNLPALQHLQVFHCDELQTLPESFGNLPALQHLQFSYCAKLQTLPESFRYLSALQHLHVYKCPELQTPARILWDSLHFKISFLPWHPFCEIVLDENPLDEY